MNGNRKKLNRLTTAAMMGAIAFVLLSINFPIPVLSPFAEIDLAALPELIGGFVLGPVGALEIIIVKIVLKTLIIGTESMYTGELQNLLLSIAFVLPAVLYYHKHKTKKGAVIGLVIGGVCKVVVGIFTNMYIIFPFYINLYGMDWAAIVDLCSAVNPWIKDVPTMIAFSVVPFNIVSVIISSLITMLVYKKVSAPLKSITRIDTEQSGSGYLIMGILLIVIQIVSFIGSDTYPWQNPEFMSGGTLGSIMHDLASLLGYGMLGIAGIVLLILAIKAAKKPKQKIAENTISDVKE